MNDLISAVSDLWIGIVRLADRWFGFTGVLVFVIGPPIIAIGLYFLWFGG